MALMGIGNCIAALIVNVGVIFVVPSKADEFMATFWTGKEACKKIAGVRRATRVGEGIGTV